MIISKKKATNLILDSKGRYFSVTSKKLNGEIRDFKSAKLNDLLYGNLNIIEKGVGYRNVKPENILSLRINKQVYQIR